MSKTLTACALVLGLAAVAAAQDKAAAKPAAPAAPAMSAEGKKFLAGWVGSWTADATMTAGPQTMQGPFRITCESVSAGWGTLCRGTVDLKGMPTSAGTFLLGWDVATGTGHMFEVVDTGEVHDHSGKWTSDKAITLVHHGKTLEGKMETDSCTATWASPTQLQFDCTGTQAGVKQWTFASTFRK